MQYKYDVMEMFKQNSSSTNRPSIEEVANTHLQHKYSASSSSVYMHGGPKHIGVHLKFLCPAPGSQSVDIMSMR